MTRIDRELVARGLAPTRSRAQHWIDAGRVEICRDGVWTRVAAASQRCDDAQQLRVTDVTHDYVSRAGFKLATALDAASIAVEGRHCLDIGASTGGFTDCLLQRGAARVVCVDVGHDQLASSLRTDARVTNIEGCNARALAPDFAVEQGVADGFDIIAMDVSFISQRKLYAAVLPLLAGDGVFVSLVKPQFELGRDALGKGGIVRDASLYPPLEHELRAALAAAGLTVTHYIDSPIDGGDGNREFLLVALRAHS